MRRDPQQVTWEAARQQEGLQGTLNDVGCPDQDPKAELIGAGRHQTDDSPGTSLEHIGWGGNLRAMHTRSEEAGHLDHPPFRPALLSRPGTRRESLALLAPCSVL